MARRSATKAVDAAEAPASTNQELRLGWLENSLTYHLRRAQDASYDALVCDAGAENWRSGLFALLMLIHENPGINQTVLSRGVGREKCSLTTSFRILEEDKLIIRERLPSDLRNYRVTLTAKGRTLMDELFVWVERHEAELYRILGPRESARFLALLRRLIEGLTQPGPPE